MESKVDLWVYRIVVCLAGIHLMVLACWQFGIGMNEGELFRFTAVNPATALLFLLAAWWLFQVQKQNSFHKRLAGAGILPVLFIGAGILKLKEPAAFNGIGVDTLLFSEKLGENRMSPMTAINFIMLGFAMLLCGRAKLWYGISFLLTCLVVLSALFSVSASLVFGDTNAVLYPFVPMAFFTALSFLLLCVGLLLSFSANNLLKELVSDKIGAQHAQRLLPYLIVFPIVLGFLRVKGQEIGLFSQAFGVTLHITLMITALLFLICREATRENKIDEARRTVEADLKQSNEELLRSLKEIQEKDRTLDVLKELQFMMDVVPQIQWVATPDGSLQYCNRHTFEYVGKSMEEIQSWGWIQLLHPDDRQVCLEQWLHSTRTGTGYEIEYRLLRGSDASYRWHLVRALPMKDDAGAVLKWFGMCIDIHDIKLLEAELRKNNKDLAQFKNLAIEELKEKSQYLNGLVKNLPIIVYKLNPQGVVTDSIGAGLNLIGLKDKQAVGIDAFKTHPEFPDRVRVALKKGFNAFEIALENGGEQVYFETYMFPDELQAGGVICFAIDITGKKLSERTLVAAKDSAELASYHKTRFLSSMSHEIRTPLNGILGFAEVLKNSVLTRAEQLEYLHQIENSGEVLLKLIGDVLDLNKIEEGKLSLYKEAFNFSHCIRSAVNPYKFVAEAKSLDFDLLIDPDIPEYLIGDAARINQVLINLLGNALKFTEAGKICCTIKISRSHPREIDNLVLQFAIQDTGIGLPADKAASVFESFTQADQSITRKFGGSGLGLTIVKQLVELMGGTIHARVPTAVISTKGGKGSLFEFTVPIQVCSGEKELKANGGTELGSFDYTAINILVAEDNDVNAMLIKHLITRLGCACDVVDNGQKAVENILENDYDLVLMDVNMPIMDGISATQIIRKRLKRDIPIIALTANTFREDVERCVAAGMNDFIGKPFKYDKLKELIAKWHKAPQSL